MRPEIALIVERAKKKLIANKPAQQQLIRSVRERLDLSTEEVAEIVGRSRDTVLAWLAPPANKKHRQVPAKVRDLLEQLLTEARR